LGSSLNSSLSNKEYVVVFFSKTLR